MRNYVLPVAKGTSIGAVSVSIFDSSLPVCQLTQFLGCGSVLGSSSWLRFCFSQICLHSFPYKSGDCAVFQNCFHCGLTVRSNINLFFWRRIRQEFNRGIPQWQNVWSIDTSFVQSFTFNATLVSSMCYVVNIKSQWKHAGDLTRYNSQFHRSYSNDVD